MIGRCRISWRVLVRKNMYASVFPPAKLNTNPKIINIKIMIYPYPMELKKF
jgi:hypothetical protein